MKRPIITILNSSTFGKHFVEHLHVMQTFAEVRYVTVPADIDAIALADRIKESDGIIASVTPKIPKETLKQCKNLVLLVRHGIGCDNVDLEAATELGIIVSRVKGIVEREAVAEYAVSLLLTASRKVNQGLLAVKDSRWERRFKMVGMELRGKTIGIIGLGNVGSRVAEILSRGFGAEVIAVDPYIEKAQFEDVNAQKVDLDTLITRSDAILFHCPLTSETKRMFDEEQFSAMRKGAVLVNTCRGELLNEDALYDSLNRGALGAYATDVVEGEPIDGNHRLARLDNVIITPHLGGYSWESLRGMGQACVDDMRAMFQHEGMIGEIANSKVLQNDYRQWN